MSPKSPTTGLIISEQTIQHRIYIVRGKRVMMDQELAELYKVPTKTLNLAVKRNAKRFPDDFMCQLKGEEFLRFQFETSKQGSGGTSLFTLCL